jgi:molybdopterin synthase sulfur carrier subunit
VRVEFSLAGPLRPYAGGAAIIEVETASASCSVRDALDALAGSHPGVERRIRDEEGRLRRHVNLFAGDELVARAPTPSTPPCAPATASSSCPPSPVAPASAGAARVAGLSNR